jgi:hypothetical protein
MQKKRPRNRPAALVEWFLVAWGEKRFMDEPSGRWEPALPETTE